MFTSCPRSVRIASWLFVLAPALFVPGRSPGQEVPGEGGDAAREAVQVALRGTLSTGRPTVLVATSRTSPESLDLWRRLMGAYGAPWISSMQWLEVSADRDPVWLVKLGITDIPSVIVFGRGPKGLEFLGRLNRPKGVEEVAAWLAPLGTGRTAREAGPPALTRAQYSTPQALPSSQAALPPPPPQL